jgi:acyl carrier protein
MSPLMTYTNLQTDVKTQIQSDIIQVLKDITTLHTQVAIEAIILDIVKGKNLDIEKIEPQLRLKEDFNFESLDVISLVLGIEDKFQQKIGFASLLMKDGQYIEELRIDELVMFVSEQLQKQSDPQIQNTYQSSTH